MGNCSRHGHYDGSECTGCTLLDLAENMADQRREAAEAERWARADAADEAAAMETRLEAIRQSVEEAAAKKDDLLADEIAKKARTLIRAGLESDALPLLVRAQALIPTDIGVRLDLAYVLSRVGRTSEGAPHLDAAAKLMLAGADGTGLFRERLMAALLETKGAAASEQIHQIRKLEVEEARRRAEVAEGRRRAEEAAQRERMKSDNEQRAIASANERAERESAETIDAFIETWNRSVIVPGWRIKNLKHFRYIAKGGTLTPMRGEWIARKYFEDDASQRGRQLTEGQYRKAGRIGRRVANKLMRRRKASDNRVTWSP